MGGEIPKLAFGNAAESSRGAQPQGVAIADHAGDVVAEEAVPGGEPEKSAVHERAQSAAEGANPDCAIGIPVERADLVAAKAVGGGEEALSRRRFTRQSPFP